MCVHQWIYMWAQNRETDREEGGERGEREGKEERAFAAKEMNTTKNKKVTAGGFVVLSSRLVQCK